MTTIPSRLAEAGQLLAACSWEIVEEYSTTPVANSTKCKTTYVVSDSSSVPRRSFVPIDRLYDYARGVFDAQEFPK